MKKLILTMSVLLAGFYILLHTGTGLALLFRFAPDEFSAEVREGNLAHGFVLGDLDYRDDGFHLTIGEAKIDWRLYSLLTGRLVINDVNIQDMVVSTTTSADTSGTTDIEFALPLDFSLTRFVIQGLTLINETTSTSTRIDSVNLAMRSDGQLIQIEEFALQAELYHAAINGSINLDEHLTHDLQLAWQYRQDESLIIDGSTSIKGDIRQTEIDTSLVNPVAGNIHVILNDLMGDLVWEARITADALNLAQYSGELLFRELDLIISGSGTLQNASLQASVTPVDSEYRVSGDYGLEIGIVHLALEAGDLLSGSPTASVQLEWEEGALLSADNNRLFNLENGQLMADYNNKQFTLQAESTFNYNNQVTGDWQIKGAGDSSLITLEAIRIDTAQGALAGNGFISLIDDQITINSNLDWDNLRIPYGEHDLALSAGSLSLSGDLDDYSLQVTTDVSLDQSYLFRLELGSAGNSEQLDLEPLTLLFPEGDIRILGMVNWADAINVDLALSGEDLNPGIFQAEWPGNLD